MFGLVLWKFSLSLGFFVTRVYSPRSLKVLLTREVSKFRLCFHSFSSSKFVIGRLLFVLVFHVGLFVFAKSRFRLKFSKVTEIRWEPQFKVVVRVVQFRSRSLRIKLQLPIRLLVPSSCKRDCRANSQQYSLTE